MGYIVLMAWACDYHTVTTGCNATVNNYMTGNPSVAMPVSAPRKDSYSQSPHYSPWDHFYLPVKDSMWPPV